MLARPGRLLLTVLGVVIGLTALVATIGLTRAAGNRIISQFDALAATELFISARPGRTTGIVDPRAIPWDAPQRLLRLNGVERAGNLSRVEVGDRLVSASPVQDPLHPTAVKMAIHAASPTLFSAVRADLMSGRLFDRGHSDSAERVAVLGPDAARRLGIKGLNQLPAISLGDHHYLIIGILRDVARKPELLGSVIIPEGTARKYFALVGPGTLVVETRIGAAYLIAEQAPLALRPDDPRVLKVEVRPRRGADGPGCHVPAARRPVPDRRRHRHRQHHAGWGHGAHPRDWPAPGDRCHARPYRFQFLLESASMGAGGGIIGASLGVLVVIAVSAYQVWTPVLDPYVPFLAPLVGSAIGLLSGTYPAVRAARLEPVEAFRH